jgi:hypothetical protein
VGSTQGGVCVLPVRWAWGGQSPPCIATQDVCALGLHACSSEVIVWLWSVKANSQQLITTPATGQRVFCFGHVG